MDKKTLLRKLREDLEYKLIEISKHLDKCEEANIEFDNAFINIFEIGLETNKEVDTDTIDEIFNNTDHEYADGLTIYKSYE